jgi:hypothetical protein
VTISGVSALRRDAQRIVDRKRKPSRFGCFDRRVGEEGPRSAVLLAINREFRKSVDWLLTGQTEK